MLLLEGENKKRKNPIELPKLSKIFQEGKGDFNNARKKVPLWSWVRHVLMWHDGRALSCKRFRYWALNTLLRKSVLGPRKAYWKQCPGDAALDINTLTAEKVKALAGRVVGQTANVPGSVGEKLKQRGDVEAMVRQIEWETAMEGDNENRGRIPAYFITFTTAIYKWDGLSRLIRQYTKPEAPWPVPIGDGEGEDRSAEDKARRKMQEAIDNPAIVEWYCSLKLELMLHLARRVLDAVDEDGGGNKDDYWASYEWGAGGIVHLHVLLWKSGSKRIEKVVRPDACGNVPMHEDDAILETEAANLLGEYYTPHISEMNADKIAGVHARREAERQGGEPRKLPGEAEIGQRQKAKHRRKAKGSTQRPPHDPCEIDWESFTDILLNLRKKLSIAVSIS